MPPDMKTRPIHASSRKHTVLEPRIARWRSSIVVALLSVGFLGLAARALWVQVIAHDFHVAQGDKRHRMTVELSATRGPIVDRHGALLAVSLTTYEIWAEPRRMDRSQWPALAQALGMPALELEKRLSTERAYVLVKRHVDAHTAQRIDQLGLAGVSRIASSHRHYPEGESVAHVVGFTDVEDNGQEGIELAANAVLAGAHGAREVIRDRLGRVVSVLGEPTPARDGATIRLTIDRRIQQLAYTQLKAALAEHRARAGSAVVLDAHTGEILALANAPSFDPNGQANRAGEALRNRALTDTFEPGSAIKPLVVALALDAGAVRPTTLIDTAPGYYTIGPNTIHDTSNHGTVTVTQALVESSNIALAKMALTLPAEQIWAKYRQYGIGDAPSLPFPGMAAGKLRPWQRWRPIEQATMGYGYGLSTSLLQIAQAYTAFASDGTFRPATLLTDAPPLGPRARPANATQRVTTQATAATIRSMLAGAVEAGGTGRAAQVDGYRVGGKTGTAWKHMGKSYVKGKYRALFVGLAPIERPRLIVAVMIDEPTGGKYYGGMVAAPVFALIAGGALQLLGVPPEA